MPLRLRFTVETKLGLLSLLGGLAFSGTTETDPRRVVLVWTDAHRLVRDKAAVEREVDKILTEVAARDELNE